MIERYIGLISGTSMDAIDAVLVGIGEDDCALEATRSHSLDATTLRGMRRLVEHPEDAGLEVLGELDVALAHPVLDDEGVSLGLPLGHGRTLLPPSLPSGGCASVRPHLRRRYTPARR